MMIVMAGCAGLKGAAEAYFREESDLFAGYPQRFRENWRRRAEAALREACSVPEDAVSLEEGTYAALWQLGERSASGLMVKQAAIPVDQYVIEAAEVLGRDPYQLPGSGYLALREGMPRDGETVIGWLTEGKGRIVETREGIRYLTGAKGIR